MEEPDVTTNWMNEDWPIVCGLLFLAAFFWTILVWVPKHKAEAKLERAQAAAYAVLEKAELCGRYQVALDRFDPGPEFKEIYEAAYTVGCRVRVLNPR